MVAAAVNNERAARRARIAALWRQGQSQYAIARAVGVSRPMVQKELRALGLTGRDKGAAEPIPDPLRAAPPPTLARLAGRKVAVASTDSGFGFHALTTVLPPPDYDQQWQRLDLDRDTWQKLSPAALNRMLLHLSPDISRAVWDYLQMLDPGHDILAVRPGTLHPAARAQAALDAFLAQLRDHHTSLKVLHSRLFMGALTRGAFFAQLVLDPAGRIPVDILTPDPLSARFKQVSDPVRGSRWQLGQWQGGAWVVLDSPLVRYVPIHPEAGSPYGRSLLTPAIFPCLFLLGLLHDLRRVVAQQGYPRVDIVIALEHLLKTFSGPGGLKRAEFEAEVDKLLATIRAEFATLEPDDAWVHTDLTAINWAKGAVDATSLAGAGDLIKALERMAMRALKTMPLIMGDTEGAAEANANRQWEVFVAGVKSLQQLCETMLQELYTLGLRAQGIQADVIVRFAELRASELLRDEQWEQLALGNAILAEYMGYRTHDEAAEHAVKHPAVAPAPAVFPNIKTGQNPAAQTEPTGTASGTQGRGLLLDARR